MKHLFLGMGILAAATAVSGSATAQVSVSVDVGIEAPPPIMFSAPPEVVVLPETTGVYVVPEAEHDIYFWNGYWWRPHGGRWFRSAYYDRGWAYYSATPEFYYDVDPYWRRHYHDQSWYGHRWEYRRIPHGELQHNWRQWRNDRYWASHGSWGVHGYVPRPHNEWERVRAERREQSRHEFQPRPAPEQPRYRGPERQQVVVPSRTADGRGPGGHYVQPQPQPQPQFQRQPQPQPQPRQQQPPPPQQQQHQQQRQPDPHQRPNGGEDHGRHEGHRER